MPIAATASIATRLFTITMDRPLSPGPLNSLNWGARANLTTGPQDWNPLAPPVPAGATVTFTGLNVGVSLGGPDVTYDPPPFDLLGVTGTPAPAVRNFPLTVMP